MISIIDYGIGNIGSIINMLKKAGVVSEVIQTPGQIRGATRLLLPGVGAFPVGIDSINESGMRDALDDAALIRRIPILGICLGAQLMTRWSEEGNIKGLGWIDAETLLFRPAVELSCRVPHMGWNTINSHNPQNPITKSDSNEQKFYFVHSYYMKCASPKNSLCETEYGGIRFDSGIISNNIVGVQFHPEKSHKYGMSLLRNFSEWHGDEKN